MYLDETERRKFLAMYFYFGLTILTAVIAIPLTPLWTAPADSVEIVAKHPEIKNSSIYQINFVVDKPIPPKAVFRIVFPIGFNLSDLMIAGSTTINGGFLLQVDGQVVTIRRSGLGKEIPANQRVDLKFGIVRNPSEPADDYEIQVELLDESEKPLLKTTRKQRIIPEKQ